MAYRHDRRPSSASSTGALAWIVVLAADWKIDGSVDLLLLFLDGLNIYGRIDDHKSLRVGELAGLGDVTVVAVQIVEAGDRILDGHAAYVAVWQFVTLLDGNRYDLRLSRVITRL